MIHTTLCRSKLITHGPHRSASPEHYPKSKRTVPHQARTCDLKKLKKLTPPLRGNATKTHAFPTPLEPKGRCLSQRVVLASWLRHGCRGHTFSHPCCQRIIEFSDSRLGHPHQPLDFTLIVNYVLNKKGQHVTSGRRPCT